MDLFLALGLRSSSMDPEFTDWVFEIETLPRHMHTEDEGEYWSWWAVLQVSGSCAIGRGNTPWEALAACIMDIGPTLAGCEFMVKTIAKLQAGELVCPKCRTPLPPMTDEHPIGRFVCDDYPNCGDTEPRLEG